jgi:uncharacterized DUF497 family protein
MLRFEWDPGKARANHRKHGITFEEAMHVFDDPFAYFEQDRSEAGEVRWRAIGLVDDMVLILVAHTVREVHQDEVIRLISARRATTKERYRYGEASAEDTWQ